MYSDDSIKFLSKNWNIFEKHDLSDPLLLFFISKNLYYSILPHLNEFSIVDDCTFNSATDDSTLDNTNHTNNDLYTSCILFSKDNYLLKESQKNLLKNLLSLKGKKEESESYIKNFRIFYSKDSEGRNYILISESCLYYIVKTLTSILENEKSNSDLNKVLAVEKCKEYLDNVKNKDPSFEFDSLVDEEFVRPVSYKFIQLSLCYFLLHINPSFSGVSKRVLKLPNQHSSNLNRKALFNCTLIVNNLIRLHPKESDLWEIKTLLTHLWFRKFKLRIRKAVLLPKGSFGIKVLPTNLYYSYLMKTVYKLFKDKLLLVDQSFIPEILSLKPFNNCVSNYLNYQYKCVVKYVVPRFMRKVKEPCNFSSLNNSKNLNRSDRSSKFNIFEEFNYLSLETRYNISLVNSIFKLFFEFYKRLLRRFSFPSIFILLVNLLKGRTYNKLQLSSINHRYLYESCYLYSRLNRDLEEVLSLCDEMIKKDRENCWVDNKSKLMYHILDLKSLVKPFYVNKELVDLLFKFKTVLIFNQHLLTWSTVLNLSKICNLCTSLYSDKSRIKLKNRLKFSRKDQEYNNNSNKENDNNNSNSTNPENENDNNNNNSDTNNGSNINSNNKNKLFKTGNTFNNTNNNKNFNSNKNKDINMGGTNKDNKYFNPVSNRHTHFNIHNKEYTDTNSSGNNRDFNNNNITSIKENSSSNLSNDDNNVNSNTNNILNRKKKNKKVKIVSCNIDEYKSESVLIRRLVEGYFEFSNDNEKVKEEEKDAKEKENEIDKCRDSTSTTSSRKPRYIYLESMEICDELDDYQIDHILNSFNQLMYILLHLFRNICRIRRNPRYQVDQVDLTKFKILFDTIRLVFKYSSSLQDISNLEDSLRLESIGTLEELGILDGTQTVDATVKLEQLGSLKRILRVDVKGSKTNVLIGVNLVKKMNKEYRLINYKYKNILKTGDEPYYLEMIVTKLSLLLLSAPFRFYLHWNISSHNKLELVFREVNKLKKLKN